jgi:rubrerythrin
MPGLRPRTRRLTIRQVLDTAIDLEKKTMDLYVAFVRAFPRPEAVRNFWFTMARHEAFHCGALALVESMVESDPATARRSVRFDPVTVARLGALVSAYQREARRGVSLRRALEMAIDLEASELEDVVADLLKVVRNPQWRERAIQLLIHDLSDLSYLVERYTHDEALLARADRLVEQRRGGLAARKAPARRVAGS